MSSNYPPGVTGSEWQITGEEPLPFTDLEEAALDAVDRAEGLVDDEDWCVSEGEGHDELCQRRRHGDS